MKKFYKSIFFFLPLLATLSFQSCAKNEEEVTAKTYHVTDISATSGTIRGTVTVSEGTSLVDAGICFSTSATYPKITNSRFIHASGDLKDFEVTLTGLSSDSLYRFRTYASTSDSTYYGTSYVFKPAAIDLDLVYVEGGTFMMGSSESTATDKEKPAHSVTLDSYYIGRYEVTNSQFAEFLNSRRVASSGSALTSGGSTAKYIATGNPKSLYYDSGTSTWLIPSGYENKPVILVTWYGAHEFCLWAGGKLPSEAEWEFAARGGNQSQGYDYSGGNVADEVAWYRANAVDGEMSEIPTQVVGKKKANELGIYDMTGNVWEWCSDWYTSYISKAQTNPSGPSDYDAEESDLTNKARRGGGWADIDLSNLRTNYRFSNPPTANGGSIGFRFAK